MVKTVIKLVDIAAGVYFCCIVANGIYEAGKDAGRKEATNSDTDATNKKSDDTIKVNGKTYVAL